jgi:hypothetical protein
LYMTKIKRFYVAHEANKEFWKCGVFITSELVFTNYSLLEKRAFIQEYFFRFFKWATLAQKKGYFFHFYKNWGVHASIAPPRGPCLGYQVMSYDSQCAVIPQWTERLTIKITEVTPGKEPIGLFNYCEYDLVNIFKKIVNHFH